MKISHICLACFYVDNMSYQENILPKMHKQQGNEVQIISSQYSFNSKGIVYERTTGNYINSDGVDVVILSYKNRWFFSKKIKWFKNLYKELEKFQPDIIFIHGGQFFDNKEVIKYKKKYSKTKIICDNHADYINTPINSLKYYLLNKMFWKIITRKLIPWTDFFWGVTPLRVKYLQEVYEIPKEKIGLLVMGGDDTLIRFKEKDLIRKKIREKFMIGINDFIVITGGKIDKKKNIEELIKAFELIKDRNIHLFIFGDFISELKILEEKCKRILNIHLLGWLKDKEIYDILLASDLAIYPGTHSVLWEQTIACGIPAVFKYWPDMQHVNSNDNCKFLYKADFLEIKDVLNNIIYNKKLYNELNINANLAKEKFKYSEIAKRSIKL